METERLQSQFVNSNTASSTINGNVNNDINKNNPSGTANQTFPSSATSNIMNHHPHFINQRHQSSPSFGFTGHSAIQVQQPESSGYVQHQSQQHHYHPGHGHGHGHSSHTQAQATPLPYPHPHSNSMATSGSSPPDTCSSAIFWLPSHQSMPSLGSLDGLGGGGAVNSDAQSYDQSVDGQYQRHQQHQQQPQPEYSLSSGGGGGNGMGMMSPTGQGHGGRFLAHPAAGRRLGNGNSAIMTGRGPVGNVG
ncbi:hypothetical protein HDU76_006676, partial [Blyttiomyces sp. JEL0837]